MIGYLYTLFVLDVWFDNMLDFKGILGKLEEVHTMRACIRNYEISVELSIDVSILLRYKDQTYSLTWHSWAYIFSSDTYHKYVSSWRVLSYGIQSFVVLWQSTDIVYFKQTTRRYIPEDRNPHDRRCVSLKCCTCLRDSNSALLLHCVLNT
jgi:hypothetical protein